MMGPATKNRRKAFLAELAPVERCLACEAERPAPLVPALSALLDRWPVVSIRVFFRSAAFTKLCELEHAEGVRRTACSTVPTASASQARQRSTVPNASWLFHLDPAGFTGYLDRLIVHRLRRDWRHDQSAGNGRFRLIGNFRVFGLGR
jgi:hypothetical protein